MAGRSHTTRTPHRFNAALNRDLFGFIARQTVATQDLRKVIYIRPHGKGFHWVRNPVSGEEYVVADGLGGATMAPGSVAMAASFSGQHGETIISRPPAGFGGASATAFQQTPSSRPDTALDTYAYTTLGFCWDDNTGKAIIARRKVTSDPVDGPVAWELEFVKVNRNSMPHLEASRNKAFCTITLTSAQSAFVQVYAMQMSSGSDFYVYYTLESGGGSTNIIRLAVINSTSGLVLKEITYSGSDSTQGVGTQFIGGYLYTIESQEGAAPGSGPPFSAHQRITKRDPNTLEILSFYTVPNPTTYDGWTIRTSGLSGIVENSGDLMAYFYYIKQPTGGADTKMFAQSMTTGLALSGSPTAFSDNNSAFLGVGNGVKNMGSGIIFTIGTDLYTRTMVGASPTLFLSGYNDDGAPSGSGIAAVSSTEVLVIGGGTFFTTSILKATGQELP